MHRRVHAGDVATAPCIPWPTKGSTPRRSTLASLSVLGGTPITGKRKPVHQPGHGAHTYLCPIKTFGPLAPNPVLTWTALKNAVVDLICRQVVPQMTFTKCLEDFKNGKWAQRKNQTVSDFEGEFLNKESILRAACEHDVKDQNRHIPCPDDMQKLFISKISSAVKIEAHVMLTERRADSLHDGDKPVICEWEV